MKYTFILAFIVIAFCSCKSKSQKASERFENSINEYNASRNYRNSLERYGNLDSLDIQTKISEVNKTMDSLKREQDSLMKIIDGK